VSRARAFEWANPPQTYALPSLKAQRSTRTSHCSVLATGTPRATARSWPLATRREHARSSRATPLRRFTRSSSKNRIKLQNPLAPIDTTHTPHLSFSFQLLHNRKLCWPWRRRSALCPSYRLDSRPHTRAVSRQRMLRTAQRGSPFTMTTSWRRYASLVTVANKTLPSNTNSPTKTRRLPDETPCVGTHRHAETTQPTRRV
jgi:hypothetical protein